jgi:hypothetical protein
MVSVLILTIRGWVRLGSNCLLVLSVCVMLSQVGHRVKAVQVARWFSDWCGSSFELLPLLGQLTVYGYRPCWAIVGLSCATHWAAMWAACK